ncbi:hypothetical protein ASE11_11315 [Hydrogenophaga sp. Root209]|uniref:hypothetical protein n=1 Tax=unclassified Hydrogenophaga TaxID=2610897 RepID=UPI0006FC4D1D|nr:hypothetical protein [Hydrogenophaga sp. Root209]KRB98908.1 hypothetical protein ASE11_11315 [Hydrogenophaga sp. Root209]
MASQSSKISSKKPKLVRDSFTIPKTEFAAIETLKTRAIALGTSVKKSELLRAGLMALQGLNDAAYKAALSAVPTLKTGRPTGTDKKPEAPKKPVSKPVVKVAAKAPVKAPVKVAVKTTAKPVAKPAAKKLAAKPAAKKAAPAKKAAAA